MQRFVGIVVVSVALALGLPVAAAASGPVQAVATGTLLSHTQTPVREADGNLTFSAVDVVALTGGISGTATDTYTLIVHPDGSITGHGSETCSACTIAGRSGGYIEVFSFMATANFTSFAGHFTVLSASGGLAGLHGEGTFQGAGFSETIALHYLFQP